MTDYATRSERIAEIDRASAERRAAENAADQDRLAQMRQGSPAEHAKQRSDHRAVERKQRDDRDLAVIKSSYRRRYMRTPGTTDADFDREWPALINNHRLAVARGENPLEQGEPANTFADPARWGLNR